MEMNTGALSLAFSARLNQLFAPAATIYSKNILFVAGPTLNAIEMRSKFAPIKTDRYRQPPRGRWPGSIIFRPRGSIRDTDKIGEFCISFLSVHRLLSSNMRSWAGGLRRLCRYLKI
ncbi:hypothetical protein [Burkholderia ubonensis]|uniref:hypothetical protein n=1 Tax=Burkholderia ubonensis TaxID=101571 RepID=UPI001160B1D0|nr:hypothetical protein [Burkholderia ubonensis]